MDNIQNMFTKDIYSTISISRGQVANIHKAYEAFSDGVEGHFDIYKKIILNENAPLNRGEREFLAVLTSQENSCSYCISHHEQASQNYEYTISKVRENYYQKLVKTLCHEPWKTPILKKEAVGILSDSEYAHAAMVVCYFNMANRLVFAQDIQIEDNFELSCQ